MILLTAVSKILKFIESKRGIMVARGWKEEKMKLLINGYEVTVKEDE